MSVSIQIPFSFAVKFLIEEGSTENQAISLLNHLAKEKGEGGLITSEDLEGWSYHEDIKWLFYEVCNYMNTNLSEDIVEIWKKENVTETTPLSTMTMVDFLETEKLYMEKEVKKEGELIKVDGEQGYLFK